MRIEVDITDGEASVLLEALDVVLGQVEKHANALVAVLELQSVTQKLTHAIQREQP